MWVSLHRHTVGNKHKEWTTLLGKSKEIEKIQNESGNTILTDDWDPVKEAEKEPLIGESSCKSKRYHSVDKGPLSQSYGFSNSHVQMWELDYKEGWALKNWYFQTGWKRLLRVPWTARSNQSILKEINPEYSLKDWCWSWSSNTWATWCEELTHWKRPWFWERLKVGEEGDDRGWDGWMASLTQMDMGLGGLWE